ncbi:hypothetical protein [Streptomyces globisporus]|uniref:hypothetical protein n=1 Tax=Streptomyces globisporus TaxID=1908 RepID=UPI00131E7A04|nr:hypothetical protein [Streptomyces globisporus]
MAEHVHVYADTHPGRYSRYMQAIAQLLAAAPAPIRHWTPRDMDTALYWMTA